MKKVSLFAVSALLVFCVVSSSRAAGGLGFHWGFDFSMSMEGGVDSLDIPVRGIDLGSAYFTALGLSGRADTVKGAAPLTMSRGGWERSYLNFGGKLYCDVVPFIDVVELSFNLGAWQYDGSVSYLAVDSIDADPSVLLSGGRLPYTELPMTLEAYDMDYFGMSGTPYAKLQFDLSLRKTVYKVWYLRFNAGAGMSVHFATPILNGALLDRVQVDEGISSPEELVARFMDPGSDMGEAVVEKILSELFTPRYGAHVVAGIHFKPPVVPLALYVDGKLMIPISKYDENKRVSGLGVMFNTGLALAF